MNRRLFYLMMLLVPVCMMAQSVQPGFVMQYNEKLDKSALPGVEIIAYGAQSTRSDNMGAFSLKFNKLVPGDRVFCSRIECAGYVIFNKDKIDQWNISDDRTPFTIVMCRENKFKAIKQNYLKSTSASYARQQKMEEDAMKAEFLAGSMKKAEYEKKLSESRQYYAAQLRNIDTYVDQFARIDLSELSDEEQEIVDLVQAGDIESAINRYENLNYIEKYEREARELSQLESIRQNLESIRDKKLKERDSIYNVVLHQVQVYMMMGAKMNVDKAGSLLKMCADADTTNYNAVMRYAYFAGRQNISQDREKYTMICYRMIDRKFAGNEDMHELHAAILENNLGQLYSDSRDFERGVFYLRSAMSRYRTLCDKSLLDFATLYSQTAQNLSMAYYNENQTDSAYNCLMEAKDIISDVMDRYPEYSSRFTLDQLEIILALNTLSLSYFNDYEMAIRTSPEVVELAMAFYKSNPDYYGILAVRALSLLGKAYLFKGNLDESEVYLMQSLDIARNMEKRNPDCNIKDYLGTYSDAAMLYEMRGQYGQSEIYYNEMYQKVRGLYEQNPAQFEEMLHVTEFNLGLLYMKMQRLGESDELFLKAKEGLMNLPGISQYARDEYFMQLNFLLAGNCIMQNRMEESFDYCSQNISFFRDKMKSFCFVGYRKFARDNAGNYIRDDQGGMITTLQAYYASSLNTAAYYYARKGDYDNAMLCIDEAISKMDGNPMFYDSRGELLVRQDRVDDAVEMYRKVIGLEPKFYELNPNAELLKLLKMKGIKL